MAKILNKQVALNQLLEFHDTLSQKVKEIVSDPIMGKWYELPQQFRQDSNHIASTIDRYLHYSEPINKNDIVVINRLYKNYHKLIINGQFTKNTR